MARGSRAARAQRGGTEIWPGFVDALSTLLLGVIFLIVVLMLAHFFLSQALTGRDEALSRLNAQIAQLTDMLALERKGAEETRATVNQLAASLQTATRERDDLQLRLRDAQGRVTVNGSPLAEADYLYPGDDPSFDEFSVQVPDGMLWVMGDHRSNSADSRSHLGDPGGGFVPESKVVGRVMAVVWPLNRIGSVPIPPAFAPLAASGGATAPR